MALEVEQVKDMELIVRAAKKAAMIPSYMGARMAMTTHLADRVQAMLATARAGAASPTMCANGWRCRTGAAQCPRPASCWSRASRTRSARPVYSVT